MNQRRGSLHAISDMPIGAHSDHNLGKITGFAINKGIHIAYGPKQNGVVEISSMQFPKRAKWHVASAPADKQNDWADPSPRRDDRATQSLPAQ